MRFVKDDRSADTIPFLIFLVVVCLVLAGAAWMLNVLLSLGHRLAG